MSQKPNEITKHLKIIYRHRYLFVAISLLVMTAMTVYSYGLPKRYQADSTVFIERNIINRLVQGIAMTPDITDQIKVLNVALVSRDIVTKVLKEIDSDIFTKSKSAQQGLISSLRQRINIKVKGKELFTVSLVDSDPAFAQRFVNALVSTYVRDNVSSNRDESSGANSFLVEQIELFKEKLERSENAIIEFRKKQGVYLSLDETTDLSEIKQFMRQIEEIELDLQTTYARQQSYRKQLESLQPTVNVFSETGGGGRIAELEKQLNDLLLRYTENYPEVIRLKAQIVGLKKQRTESIPDEDSGTTTMTSINPLYQELQQNIFEVETEIRSLEAKKANLQELIKEREANLQDVPVHKKELAVLIQERNSHREIYQELLKRMGQSEVSKQMEISDKTSNFRVVDAATYPETPVSPNMVKQLLLAIFGGLGCGLGLVIVIDYLDSSVNDPLQLEEMGVEVLALIPNISDGVDDVRTRRMDMVLYFVGALYFSCFIALLVNERFHFV